MSKRIKEKFKGMPQLIIELLFSYIPKKLKMVRREIAFEIHQN